MNASFVLLAVLGVAACPPIGTRTSNETKDVAGSGDAGAGNMQPVGSTHSEPMDMAMTMPAAGDSAATRASKQATMKMMRDAWLRKRGR